MMLWLPATELGPAELRVRMFVSELDPSFEAITPWKSVSACRLVESALRSLPTEVNAVSSAFKRRDLVLPRRLDRFEVGDDRTDGSGNIESVPLVAAPKLMPYGSHGSPPREG